jgi:hypothetical protein
MRRASYEIPPAKGDKEPGELNVFVLGGEVEPNIQRWIDEFSGFDRKTLVRADRTVNDMPQAVVEIPKGKFDGGMADNKVKDNYGLLGAIIVTPPGAKYFFKLTGPSKTIKAAREPFYKMLDSMHIEGGTPAAHAEGAKADTPKTDALKTEAPGTKAAPPAAGAKPAERTAPAAVKTPAPEKAPATPPPASPAPAK